LFATDRDFIVYSFSPLLRALLFNGIGLVTLAAIALGVSALARKPQITTIVWMGLWLILAAMAAQPRAPEWIKLSSYTRNLGEVRQEIFRLDTALGDAAANLPILDQRLVANLAKAGKLAEATDFTAALVALGVVVGASSFVFFRKIKPE